MKPLLSCLLLLGLVLAPTVQAEPVDGRLQWAGQRDLGLLTSGLIERVSVRAGQTVIAGAELLRLDPRPFAIRRDLASAELEGIRPAYEEAEAELERAQDLLDRTVISEADFRLAEIAFKQARASYQAAAARLALAEWELENSSLRADVDVRILAVRVRPGQAVNSRDRSEVLLTVADAGYLEAEASITQRQAQALNAGDSLRLRFGRTSASGVIEALEHLESGGPAGRYRLVVRFADTAGTLPDLTQTVRIELP